MRHSKLHYLGLALVAMLAACSGSQTSSLSPIPTTTAKASQKFGASGPSFVFSQYKDVGINANWNTYVISTVLTSSSQWQPVPLVNAMPANNKDITLAFATGECGTTETWAGITPAEIASANIPLFESSGKDYIVGTGGAAGAFTCGTPPAFVDFIKRYYSPNMIGVDFDIEVGQSKAVVDQLITDAIFALQTYPNMRFSFTVATLAPTAAVPQSLGSEGAMVVQELQNEKMTNYPNNYTVNLMTMDYGSPGPYVCYETNGACNMGQSAVQAAEDLNQYDGVPYSNIELTPMIGLNDVNTETFSLADVDTTVAFAQQNHLAGLHFWSFDRDTDCNEKWVSSTCSSTTGPGLFGYTNEFLKDLSQ